MNASKDRSKLFSNSFLIILLTISVLTNIVLITKLKYPGIITKIQHSLIPGPKALSTDHARGNKKAKYLVIEYADFQCLFCAKFHLLMKSVMKDADVRWVYRHFPLPSHPLAAKAAEAAECAGEQGKFWEYSDALFALEGKLTEDSFTTAANKLGLDWISFGLCMRSEKFRGAVAAQYESGMKQKVTGTPTFYINGKRREGVVPAEELKKMLGLNAP